MTNATNTVHTRTWTAIDAQGNASTKAQTISVELDTEAPVIVETGEAETVSCDGEVKFAQASASDNCTLVSFDHEDTVIDNGCGAVHTRTWTATDAQGNLTTAEQTITVTDEEVPVFNVAQPDDLFFSCTDNLQWTELSATDNCNLVSLESNETVEYLGCSELRTRTWTAVDGCGNVALAVQTMMITDDEAPVTTGPDVETVYVASINDFAPATPVFTDNCGAVTVSQPVIDIATTSTTYTWTATDECGNTSTKQIIGVNQVFLTPETLESPLSDLQVYPNPSFGPVTVELNFAVSGFGQLEILDMQGQLLQQRRIETVSGYNQFQIDTGRLPAGTYLIRVLQDGEFLSKRFVKLATRD